jgi:uncharacterized protein YbjT (DUF2867 family)
MIVVTGATGNVGRQVVRSLADRGVRVRAVARRPGAVTFPPRVEVVAADLATRGAAAPALAGARGVFLLGTFATPELLAHAREAGVEHVVALTSRCVVGGRPDNAVTGMWLDAEAAVRASGVPWTILRPSGFHANALRWLPQLRQGDVVRAPWPGVPIASIDPADIAAVAATALTDLGAGLVGAAPSLSGPEPLTPGDQVATLARVLGRPLRYEPLGDADARAAMLAEGTPAEIVDALFRFFTDGEFDDSPVLDTVQRITGRPPRTFDAWARDSAAAFAPVGPRR